MEPGACRPSGLGAPVKLWVRKLTWGQDSQSGGLEATHLLQLQCPPPTISLATADYSRDLTLVLRGGPQGELDPSIVLVHPSPK